MPKSAVTLRRNTELQRSAELQQARRMVAESIQIYNKERPHLSLKMRTPAAVHRACMVG
jgi:putative transposase